MTAGFDPQGLRRKRKALGLSVVALGELVGVSHQAVSSWERGVTRPDLDILPDLALHLGCRIDDLFTTPAVGAGT